MIGRRTAKGGLFLGLLCIFCPLSQYWNSKKILIGIPAHCWHEQWSWRGVLKDQFLPDAKGGFLFAQKAWSSMAACHRVPEIRLAIIPLLTSLAQRLVSAEWR